MGNYFVSWNFLLWPRIFVKGRCQFSQKIFKISEETKSNFSPPFFCRELAIKSWNILRITNSQRNNWNKIMLTIFIWIINLVTVVKKRLPTDFPVSEYFFSSKNEVIFGEHLRVLNTTPRKAAVSVRSSSQAPLGYYEYLAKRTIIWLSPLIQPEEMLSEAFRMGNHLGNSTYIFLQVFCR